MREPIQGIADSVGAAMLALLDVNRYLLQMGAGQSRQAEPEERPEYATNPAVGLTDEFNPVRISGPDCYLDLSFEGAARLWLKLGQVRQVMEHAEEIARG